MRSNSKKFGNRIIKFLGTIITSLGALLLYSIYSPRFSLGIIISVIIIGYIAVFFKAREIGYSGCLWFFVSIFSFCSGLGSYLGLLFFLISLYLLGTLPNRKLDQQRAREMKLLEKQLQQVKIRKKSRGLDIPNSTIGDDETIL